MTPFLSSLFQVGDENSPLDPQVLKIVLDLTEDFERVKSKTTVKPDSSTEIPLEAFTKLHNEQWVIAKSADRRKVYVIITNKCATLMDANDEFSRLMSTEFKNVFMPES